MTFTILTGDYLADILRIIMLVVGIVTAYQVVFIFVGFFWKGRKYRQSDKKHKYGILIAARNEAKVIGELIDSIKKQDYPQELLTIFVVADDCTDETADIARKMGCVVYERPKPPKKERKKSYALKLALENIARDYATETQPNGIETFDGFFVFDADNLLAPHYIAEMNNAFIFKKYDYFTSYLSEKNLETHVIRSFGSIGLGGLYSADMTQHRCAAVFGIAPLICGKGFLIRSEFLKDGWKWFGITEDIELRSDIVGKGTRGCFVESAELFDENPHTFRMLVRQRMRWERGSLMAFFKYFWRNFLGIFWPIEKRKSKSERAADLENLRIAAYNPDKKRQRSAFSLKLADFFQKRFSCYNQAFLLMPRPFIFLSIGFIYPLISAVYYLCVAKYAAILSCLWSVLTFYGMVYLIEIVTYVAVIFRERNRIRGNPKRIFKYIFVWPFFTMCIQYVSFIVMFIPVKWKPIPHFQNFQIDEIKNKRVLVSGHGTDKTDEQIVDIEESFAQTEDNGKITVAMPPKDSV